MNIGKLYKYPYEVVLRNPNKTYLSLLEENTPFVVLDYNGSMAGTYLKVLTAEGQIGYVAYSKKHLQEAIV